MTAGPPEDKMGLMASHTVPLSLDDVWVPQRTMLSGEGQGFPIAMAALDGGRIGIGSQSMGIAQAALDEVRKHLREDANAAVRAQERL
jgi:alkylation response protein AidB-like acyl-CoA dehydrogenase